MRRRSHHMSVRHRRGMNPTSDKACEVCHVNHEIRSDFIGDRAHTREVELARISAAAANNRVEFAAESSSGQ